MKIRVISDLHINLLQKKFIPLYKKDNILTLIAGDISLNPSQTYKYVSKNFNDAILIGGNHLFYSNVPIEIKHQVLHEYFPMNSNQVFLEREYKVIDNYVVIGATFWSALNSFESAPYDEKKFNKFFSQTQLKKGIIIDENNTYKKLKVISKLKHTKSVGPEWFRDINKKSVEFIIKTAKLFPKKKIIVMIHFPFSWKSLDPKFKNHWSNPMTFSNLDAEFCHIKNLHLVIHGHVHQSHHYFINRKNLTQIKKDDISEKKYKKLHKDKKHYVEVVCNPLGRIVKLPNGKPLCENERFNKNLIIEI